MNAMQLWSEEIDFPVTICDPNGIIVAMNHKSMENFKKDGGGELIGKSLLDCHPDPARSRLVTMLMDRQANTYLDDSKGRQRLIHQTPWFVDGEYKGFIELILNIPGK